MLLILVVYFRKKKLKNLINAGLLDTQTNVTLTRLVPQALGVSSQGDRSTVKKKLKELRKAQEKLEKQREKREKEVRRSGRLAGSDSYC